MKVTLRNMTRNLEVYMMTTRQYTSEIAYPHIHAYPRYVNDYMTFALLDHDGLLTGGSTVSNTTATAVNTNGQLFRGNRWGALTFTLYFRLATGKALSTLVQLIHYKNEPLYVEIENEGQTYYLWCIIDGGDAVEAGEITFQAAFPGSLNYWSAGDDMVTYKPQVTAKAFVNTLPEHNLGLPGLISNEDGKLTFAATEFIVGEQFPIITVNNWPTDYIKIHHQNSGTFYEYVGDIRGKKLEWDSRDQTFSIDGVVQESNIDTIQFSGGNEVLIFTVDDNGEHLSEDSYFGILYEKLYTSVFN